ncbi:MAG: glycosyltransferase family 4 protein [Bacteroidota bacterium]|nr:glycosyltransferase family 4 protein [Bacteroidota bacterium]
MNYPRPMRVLVVGHTYIVAENRAKLLALAATQKVKIGLLAPKIWPVPQIRQTFRLEDTPDGLVQIFSSKVICAGRLGAYLFPPLYLLSVLRDFKPDIIHVEAELFSVISLQMILVGKIAKLPITLFCWENMNRKLGIRLLNTKLVARSLAYLFAGNKEALALARSWGYFGEAIVIPQLGVKISDNLRPKSFQNHNFIVAYVGRLVYEKGVDLLLHAISDLVKKEISVRLYIVGAGPEEKRLRELAQELGIVNRIFWYGWVSHKEVSSILSSAHVLVLPSRTVPYWSEQFGHVLIEAMAEGIPVVGSSCGAIPDVIDLSDLVFPEGHWQALSRILQKLATDPEYYESCARHSVQRVKNFTHEEVAKKMIECWDKILEHGTG